MQFTNSKQPTALLADSIVYRQKGRRTGLEAARNSIWGQLLGDCFLSFSLLGRNTLGAFAFIGLCGVKRGESSACGWVRGRGGCGHGLAGDRGGAESCASIRNGVCGWLAGAQRVEFTIIKGGFVAFFEDHH